MILETFAIFGFVAFVVVILGNLIRDAPLKLLGGIFLTVLGFWTLVGGIQLESGQQIDATQTIVKNSTITDNSTLATSSSIQNQTLTNKYSDFSTPDIPAKEALFLFLIALGMFESITATIEMFIGKSIHDS